MWGTAASDRRWIIREPILAPTLEEEEEDCRSMDQDEDSSLAGIPCLSNRNRWEGDSSDE
jgi:hypothetical protein